MKNKHQDPWKLLVSLVKLMNKLEKKQLTLERI